MLLVLCKGFPFHLLCFLIYSLCKSPKVPFYVKKLVANHRLLFSARGTRNNFPWLYLSLAAIACIYALFKVCSQVDIAETWKTDKFSCYFRLNLNFIFDVLFPANFFLFDNFSLGQFCMQKYQLLTVCCCTIFQGRNGLWCVLFCYN